MTPPRTLARATGAFAVTTVLGVAGTLAVTVAPSASGATTGTTPYAYQGNAFGTEVVGGSLPTSSGRTAYVYLPCSRRTGHTFSNSVAGADLGGAVKVGAVASRTWTYRTTGALNTKSVNTIASLVAGQAGGPQLTIKGLRTISHTWHNAKGFHTTVDTTGAMVFAPVPGLPGTPLPLPGAGQTVALPGLGSLTGGYKHIRTTSYASTGGGSALRLHLDSSGSDVQIGHAWTRMDGGVPVALMGGQAFGSTARALDGTVTSGRTALEPLPCAGTRGKIHENTTASLTLPGAVSGGATVSKVYGIEHADGRADAWTRSAVASVSLGGGQAVLNGIVAKAHVRRTAGGTWTVSSSGTTPGSITAGGKTQALPSHGTYDVPGLAHIETGIVTRTKHGIRVVAVRITLLSGSAANTVIDLGNAATRLRTS